MGKIIKIEDIETPEYVYDPVCEAPHAYISNGFISHNCVLADEIDKGLGGIGSGGGDSGTSSRVLGTFLTWLQECKEPVFTVVTANNIDGLPPELLRKGRFDEIFSVGFPHQDEMREVLDIHLRKRGWDIADFAKKDIQAVINKSKGFVPAELEAAVKDGLVEAFSSDEEFSMDHVVQALEGMVPLSISYAEKIQAMTLWMENNATPASTRGKDADTSNVASLKPRTRLRGKKDKE